MTLFRPDELVSVGDFFISRFGKSQPGALEAPVWREAETKQFLESAPFAIRNYFKVADKDGNLVHIKPFVFQAFLSTALESQRRRGYPQRAIEIKPRQVGGTTWCIGECVWTALHPNKKAMVLVNDEDVAGDKAGILAAMLNGLPPHMQPKRRIQNLKHIIFDNPNPKERSSDPGLNAQVQITVPSGMRGSTPHIVVISEYAHMDDERKEEVNSGLLTGMGLRKAACVIIDTTANGYDLDYYPMVMEACEDNPKWIKRIENTFQITADDVFAGKLGEPENPGRGFVPVFSTVWQHDEYTTRNESERAEWPKLKKAEIDEFVADIGKNQKYDAAEEQYWKERGVSIFRLFWRRRKIDSIKQPSQELKLLVFRQEFPTTVEGAFVNYGKSPFDRECLDAVIRQGREPIAKGILREQNGRIGIDTTYHSDWQEIRLYAPPEGSEQFSMGVDTGIRYASKDADAWVAQIVRFSDNKVVATYEARVDEHQFREQLYLLYRWYNHAYTGIELAGSGFSLVRSCMEMGLRNQYYWKRLDAEQGAKQSEPTAYPGWETNGRTRPIMDDTLVEAICRRNPVTNKPMPDIIIPDIPTLKELQSVERMPTGAIKSKGGHDDHVDALAISLCVARDPWGGFRRGVRENPPPERPDNFSAFSRRWKARTIGSTNRNRPDLAQL